MSVYTEIQELARNERLRNEIYSAKKDRNIFPDYENLRVPAFFIECYLSDRFNGKQFVINFEFATI